MKILRAEVESDYKSSGGLFELMDNAFITSLNVTIQELDFICGEASEEELNIIAGDINMTFSNRRKVLEIRNKYLKIFNEK